MGCWNNGIVGKGKKLISYSSKPIIPLFHSSNTPIGAKPLNSITLRNCIKYIIMSRKKLIFLELTQKINRPGLHKPLPFYLKDELDFNLFLLDNNPKNVSMIR